jgi:hypothetical protein
LRKGDWATGALCATPKTRVRCDIDKKANIMFDGIHRTPGELSKYCRILCVICFRATKKRGSLPATQSFAGSENPKPESRNPKEGRRPKWLRYQTAYQFSSPAQKCTATIRKLGRATARYFFK